MNHASTVTRRVAAAGLQLAQGSARPVLQRPAPATTATRLLTGLGMRSSPWCCQRGPSSAFFADTPSGLRMLSKTAIRAFASRSRPAARGAPAKPPALKPLRHAELAKILGPDLPRGAEGTAFGNELLQSLQEQRLTGTLDKALEHELLTADLTSRGLSWLRANHPADEDAAIVWRIEQEEEGQYQRAVRWKPQQRAESEGVYGKPKLDAIRARNKEIGAAREAEEATRREQELADTQVTYETQLAWRAGKMQRRVDEVHATEGGRVRRVAATSYIPAEDDAATHVQQLSAAPADKGLVRAPNGYAVLRPRDERIAADDRWWHKYERAARLTEWDGVSEPPRMPLWRRLGLPSVFVVAVLGACLSLAQVYEPPAAGARLFPDVPPAAATVYALVAANLLVFAAWRVPPLWRLMNKNFLMHAVIPAPFQLLGCVFSHQQILHLTWNMFLLWSVGTSLCDQIGRGNFLATYFGAGVISSWVSLCHFVVTKSFRESSLGASGALSGILFCYLLLNSGKRFEIPLPGESGKKLYISSDSFMYTLVALEIFGLVMSKVRRVPAKIDHFSHLGGFMAGWGAAQLLKKQARERGERRRPVVRAERPRWT